MDQARRSNMTSFVTVVVIHLASGMVLMMAKDRCSRRLWPYNRSTVANGIFKERELWFRFSTFEKYAKSVSFPKSRFKWARKNAVLSQKDGSGQKGKYDRQIVPPRAVSERRWPPDLCSAWPGTWRLNGRWENRKDDPDCDSRMKREETETNSKTSSRLMDWWLIT